MNRIRRTIDVVLILLFVGAAIAVIGMWLKDRPFPTTPPAAPTTTSDSKHEMRILAWNVESGGSDTWTIAKQLWQLPRASIICLSEVAPSGIPTYQLVRQLKGEHTSFATIRRTSGGDDCLQMIYDALRLELLEIKELTTYREFTLNDGQHRSPLAVLFLDTLSDQRFWIVHNHLGCGTEELRNKQAIGLREWTRDQAADTAVVVIGDLDFDFNFRTGKGNQAFVELARDNVLSWVKPQVLIDTNWSDQNADGKDDDPDSMQVGAFVAGPAKAWSPACKIIQREGDFPDNEMTSDHRPVQLRIEILRK